MTDNDTTEPPIDRQTPAEINGIPVILDEAQADGTMRFRMNFDVMGPFERLIDAAATVTSWRESGLNTIEQSVARSAARGHETAVSSKALDDLIAAIGVARRADSMSLGIMAASRAEAGTVVLTLSSARRICKMLAEPDKFDDDDRVAVNELMSQALARKDRVSL